MAGPRFADLEKQGKPVRFDDLVQGGGEVVEAPSGVESFARGAYQGAGMGFADEQAGALDAIGGHLKRTFTNDWKRTGGGWWDDIKAEAEQVANDYRKGRDESRQAYSEAAEANPTAYGVGQFGGAVATGLLTGGASALGREGLKGALTAGALEGAAGGLGGSNADLTHADLDAYAKAFRDSAEGGVMGAGLGVGFYGVGKGLKWIGGKAVDGLRRARGELAEGVAAERELADEAARAAEDKVARAEAKRVAKEAMNAERAAKKQQGAKERMQKEFRAANERTQVDKRYADPNAAPPPRAGGRPARAPVAPEGPMEDPNTAILGGYRGKAGERRAVNYDRVRQYRQDIADPNFTGDRARLEQYAREYGDAVDNPGAFERRMVERYLRENYPPEVADRILRERVGPNGEILPRGGAPESVTQAADLGDAFRQGRGPEVARQGGGGSAFGQDYPADARTVSDMVPEGWDPGAPKSGDPFHDAPTRVGLIETSADGGYPGEGQNFMRDFEFRDPKSGRIVKMTTHRTPNYPEGVTVDGIGFKDQVDKGLTYEDQWGAGANKVGPRVLKEVLGDLRRAYPGSEVVGGQRVTGITPGRNTEVPMPEVTSPGSRTPWLPEPTQVMDTGDAVRQGRFDDLLALGRSPNLDDLRGPAPVDMTAPPSRPAAQSRQYAPDPFHDAKTQIALIESERLPGVRPSYHEFEFRDPKSGREFTADLDYNPNYPDEIMFNGVKPKGFGENPEDYAAAHEVAANSMGPGMMKQLSQELARRFPEARRLTGYRSTGANAGRMLDVRLPEVTQRMDLGDAVKQGRGDIARMGGGGSAWDGYGPEGRTISDVVPEGRDISAPRSGDPFHDAPTRVGMIETTPEHRGVPEVAQLLESAGRGEEAQALRAGIGGRTFEFRDPKSGRIISMNATRNADGNVWVDEIAAADRDVINRETWGQDANSLGPRALKQVLPDVAKAFPGAKMVGGERVTGMRRGRDFDRPAREAWAPLPEVTQRMAPADVIQQAETSGREPPISMDDLRQWTGTPEAPADLPLLEDLTQPGAPSFPSDVRRAQPFQAPPQLRPEYQPRPPATAPAFDEALAQRRAMGAQAQAGAGGMPTRNLRAVTPPPPVFDPNNSMVSPRDFEAETVVPLGDTQVPRSPRPAPYAGPVAPELAPEPVLANPLRQARPRPLAPPVAPPSQTTMGAPPGSLVRQARPSVEDLAMQREQGALGDVLSAGWEGARSSNNALAAPFGAAYGIGKEAMQNPAVRARAISLFRLDRLARIRPEVWARVGPTLQRAFQSGPERFKAERHVLLLRDPEFRAAEAEADAELERIDGQPPTRRVVGR